MNDLFNFLIVILFSMMGGILILLRKKKEANEYFSESMEWLILALMPSAVSIPLFSNLGMNLEWFLVPYIFGLMTWFLLVVLYVLNQKDADKVKTRNASYCIIPILVGLTIFGIYAYWYLQNLHSNF